MSDISDAFKREFGENKKLDKSLFWQIIAIILVIAIIYMSMDRTNDLKNAMQVGYANCMNRYNLFNATKMIK